jgi:hypothetical protein
MRDRQLMTMDENTILTQANVAFRRVLDRIS